MPRLIRNVTAGLYMITAICGLIDPVCFLVLGGVFAEMMTGNLLLLALYAGRGTSFDQVAHYVPAIVAFAACALLLQFDVAWPLVVNSVMLTVAKIPLMYGETPAKS